MTYVLPADPGDQIELTEYLAHLDAHLDVRDEDSVLATAPKLRALANNRRFLAKHLVESLAKSDFQKGNRYVGPTFLLERRRDYVVRVVGWPTAPERTPSDRTVDAYSADEQMAHNHTMGILTVGYWGPGYETDLFECDPDALTGEAGQPYQLAGRGRERLSVGKVMYYRPHVDVHIQNVPEDYSISLNLLIPSRHKDHYSSQYFFDVARGKVVGVGTTVADAERSEFLNYAGIIRHPSFFPHLEKIAAGHPRALVRKKASEILRAGPDLSRA